MKVVNLGSQNSILKNFIAELRDEEIQKDSMRFRQNLKRIGQIFAYEISKQMDYEKVQVQTPLGIAETGISNEEVLVASILRAGLPMHEGVLSYFDKAQNAFISAYRKYGKDNKFTISFEHISSPSAEDKTAIICDPMLATGASMVLSYRALIEKGMPKKSHIVTIIASLEGVEYIKKNLSNYPGITLWLGDIDDELTVKSYIVPGLGDSGDLAFGSKI